MTKIVLTGGPCCGKTTLIDSFFLQGYEVVREAARDILKERKKFLITDEENLLRQRLILEEQLRRESLSEIGKSSTLPIFHDRGVFDSASYCEYLLGNIPPSIHTLVRGHRYDLVFLLDLLPFEDDGLRNETAEDAKIIHGQLKKTYAEYGFSTISVPVGLVNERRDFILKYINEHSS